MSDYDRKFDPYGGHYFVLMLGDGAGSTQESEVAHFLECSGLKTSSTVFEIEEGGVNGFTHKRPGQSKWENIVLKYATNASMDLLSFRDEFVRDQFAGRRSGTIIMKNNDGSTIRSFSFVNAWPVAWEGPSLNAGNSELAVETLELAHEGITVE